MRRTPDRAPAPVAWDPDAHWERGHRELRKQRLKQAMPYLVVGVGIAALVVWAWNNEPEVPDDQVPATVVVDDPTLLPPGVTTPATALPGSGDGGLPGGSGAPEIEPIPLPLPVPLPGPGGEPQEDT